MKTICKFCSKEIEYKNHQQYAGHLSGCKKNPNKNIHILKIKNKLKGRKRTSGILALKYKINCKKCAKEFIIKITTKRFEKGIYKKHCSRSCANGRIHTEESKKKISYTLKKKEKNLTQETIKKRNQIRIKNGFKRDVRLCVICAAQHLKYTQTCSKKCRKILGRQLALKQIKHGGGKKGYYKGFQLDSTYELAFVIYHLDHNINIKRCSLNIEYYYNGIKRIYVPDFEVNEQIYELKGFLDNKSQVKLEQAKLQGYNIQVIRKNEIKPYLKYVEDKYNLKNHIYLLYEDLKTKECLYCKKQFKAKNKSVKFCSYSCGTLYRNNTNPLSEESKQRISLKLKGRHHTEEAKLKMKIKRNQRLERTNKRLLDGSVIG